MFDLDGVIYIGRDAVPGAPAHVAAAREAGLRCAFVTNNAARAPQDVADHLRELGVEARAGDVVTSAQAAAQVLVERLGIGAMVVLLGGRGLDVALRDVGLVPVGVEDEAVAVATGYGPDVRWHDVMRVAVRVREGLPWVACNTDMTIPTAFGLAPGHGVLVDTIRRFTPGRAGRGGQAGTAVARRDDTSGGRRAAAHDRRSSRHRHRRREERRDRLVAGDDGSDRRPSSWWLRVPRSGRRTSGPT